MGKMRTTRRAMQRAKHSVGHIVGKVEQMTCSACGESVEVGKHEVVECRGKQVERSA